MAIGLAEAARRAGADVREVKLWEMDGQLDEHRRRDKDGNLSGYRESVVRRIRQLFAEMPVKTAAEDAGIPAPSGATSLPPPATETWRKIETYERSVYANDFHAPYHDERAVGVFLSFLHWFQPRHLFIIGDFVDFYQLSKFDKDPARKLQIQEDLNTAVDVLRRIRRVIPGADITYIEGNHEARLRRFLWQHEEIAGLDAMRLENLLHFEDYGITYVRAMETFLHHGFCVEHGEIVRQKSGYTARGQLEKRGVSGISGHTHRMGAHYHTDMGGDYIWLENGCLANRKPEYARSPDWQQGFSASHHSPATQRFCIEQILIHDGLAIFAGREFSALTDI